MRNIRPMVSRSPAKGGARAPNEPVEPEPSLASNGVGRHHRDHSEDSDAEHEAPPPRFGRDGAPEPEQYSVEFEEGRIDPDAAKVVKRLTRAGYEAYLVGGAARDLLIGRPPNDSDGATSARPAAERRLVRNSRLTGRRSRLVPRPLGGGRRLRAP